MSAGLEICDRLRRERGYEVTPCGIIDARMTVAQAAGAFGLDDSAICRTIGRAEADAIAIRVLFTDLAYGSKIMPPDRAAGLWQQFLAAFEEQDIRFVTNGTADGSSWGPATSSTFDQGVLVIGPARVGCLWVEGED